MHMLEFSYMLKFSYVIDHSVKSSGPTNRTKEKLIWKT